MGSLENATIDQKIQRVKAEFRQTKDRRYAFESVLRDHYEHLRAAHTSTQAYITESMNALHGALNEPELVDQQLLVDFISEIIRFVENVGLGFEFGKAFMDRAILVYRRAGLSPISLYLEKANLLRLDQIEGIEREEALLEAKKYAEASNHIEWLLEVLLASATYYTEVSQYPKSLRVCRECEKLIQCNSQLQKYTPKLLVLFGMNYVALFRNRLARNYLLQAKILLDREASQQHELQKDDLWVRSVETIHHYLGRIAEAEGNAQQAMDYYTKGYRYLQMLETEDLPSVAFYHLRMGELLISASLLEQARDHLYLSQNIFDTVQFSSSGRLQVSMAWATLCNKEGNYTKACDYLLNARKVAQQKHFSRGELWCLVKLFWLELQHLHVYRAISIFVQALGTWRNGELRRSGGIRLFGHYLSDVLSTPFKLLGRAPHAIMGVGLFNVSLSTCICPIHQLSNLVDGPPG